MNHQKDRTDAVQNELERRKKMYQLLVDFAKGKESIPPEFTEEKRIYRGGRGIYRDLKKTQGLTEDRHGVTVSIYYNPERYNDKISEGKYYFPVGKSKRTETIDWGDIEATKNSYKLCLPIFVISKEKNLRRVEVGFIDGWDEDDDPQFFKFHTVKGWIGFRENCN